MPTPSVHGQGANLHIQEKPNAVPLWSLKALQKISKTSKGLMRHSGRAQGLKKVPSAVFDLSVYTKAPFQITILVNVSAFGHIAKFLSGKNLT